MDEMNAHAPQSEEVKLSYLHLSEEHQNNVLCLVNLELFNNSTTRFIPGHI